MSPFRDAAGQAIFAGTSLRELARQAGISTPSYVYDLGAIGAGVETLVRALGDGRHLVAYALKANSAGSIVREIARAGAGGDVVSGGELELALRAGIPPRRVVMSGVAKSTAEIDRAIGAGIRALQAESVEEIDRIAARAKAQSTRARISVRVNPGVEIDSHAHVATGHDGAKFGVPRADAAEAVARALASTDVELVGISGHVGSMLSTTEPYAIAARVVCGVARSARERGAPLEFVDFGGGFGIDYGAGAVEPPSAFAATAVRVLGEERLDDLGLVVEPGRALVGPHGVLLASVVQTKTSPLRVSGSLSGARRWAMIDAGMNDLIRPALYAARHRIEPLDRPPGGAVWRVVGPVCESADDFGEHALGDEAPDVVVIRDVGAYGFTMSSEYNGRALSAEVFARDGKVEKVSASPGVERWIAGRLGA